MNFNDFNTFFNVVKHRSFLKAAKELGVPHSTVSRRVKSLELELNTQLLHRTTRKISPTDIGLELYNKCNQYLYKFEVHSNLILDNNDKHTREYKISMPTRAGLDYLASWITSFQLNHSNIRFHIELSNEKKDLIDNQLDLAFRVGPLLDSTNIAQYLWDIPYALYIHPTLLKKLKINHTVTIDELAELPCIVSAPTKAWSFKKGRNIIVISPNAAITIDDLQLSLEAAENKLGVCYIPTSLVQVNKSKLIQLNLKGHRSITRKMYAYYSKQQGTSAITRGVIEHVKQQYKSSFINDINTIK